MGTILASLCSLQRGVGHSCVRDVSGYDVGTVDAMGPWNVEVVRSVASYLKLRDNGTARLKSNQSPGFHLLLMAVEVRRATTWSQIQGSSFLQHQLPLSS